MRDTTPAPADDSAVERLLVRTRAARGLPETISEPTIVRRLAFLFCDSPDTAGAKDDER